jgi:hypothetical protein
MIMDFLKELNVTASAFEKFYGIPQGTIKVIKHGDRNLPARYWHIIYEKIHPKFGVGFASEVVIPSEKRPSNRRKVLVTKSVTKPHKLLEVKGRLKDLID